MEILGIEKVSMVDYPNKICATIFTGGCNFRCPFCHNSGLVKQAFEKYKEKEILDYLESRKNLLDAVTISGGEPTLQPDLEDFIRKIKLMGYLIKLDTNGTNPLKLKCLIDNNLLDYVAMDIKNNFDNYSNIVGIACYNPEKVKQSLLILKESGVNYELRTTLVKGYHEKENMEKLAQDLKGEEVLFLQKFVDSGDCLQNNLKEVPQCEALDFKEILKRTIKNVQLRGY